MFSKFTSTENILNTRHLYLCQKIQQSHVFKQLGSGRRQLHATLLQTEQIFTDEL